MFDTVDGKGKRRPRWRRRSDARPGEIAAAALEVFAERGFAGARMEEIARRAGVTKGTVYLYFPSKEDLFRAVVRESIVPGVEIGERLVSEFEGDSAALLRELVWRWWEFMEDPRVQLVPKLIQSESANFPELATFYVTEVVQRVRRLFAAVIRRGVERGEFREVDPVLAARLAVAPLHNAVAYRRSLLAYDEGCNFEGYVEMHIEMFLRGLAKGTGDESDA